MKTTQTYYHKGLFLFNERGWPDRSVMKHIGAGEEHYPAALTSAIESSVPFEDQEKILHVVGNAQPFIEDGAGVFVSKEGLYTMPEVEVHLLYFLPWRNSFVSVKDCIFNKSEATKVVARIVDSSPEPVKQETQEQIDSEIKRVLELSLMDRNCKKDTALMIAVEETLHNLKTAFTVTRKSKQS